MPSPRETLRDTPAATRAPSHRGARRVISIACAIGALALIVASDSEDTRPEETPRPTGVVEKAQVRLILLDVEARDKAGRPLRGLRPGDFRLLLDSKEHPIYSVDDLCGCADAAPDGATDTRREQPGPAPFAEPTLFVLYFDFSQLQQHGRHEALNGARRWLREVRSPDDEVMLVGYATASGLRELSPPTRNEARLQAALDAAEDDRGLVDSFPIGFLDRVDECDTCVSRCRATRRCINCVDCCPCRVNATEEYIHGKRSLRALRRLLEQLEERPGRKAVLFFHENEVISPGSFYPLPDSRTSVGTHETLLGQVGAEATTSRATIYAIQMGDNNHFGPLSSAAVELSAELADYTGGAYNRGPSDYFAVMRRAVEDCSCRYRIGFAPPDATRTRVHEAKVQVAGDRIPNSYRVQFVSDDDRLARKARAVMSHPESASAVPLVAALEPVARNKRRWGLTVRLALDVDATSLLPAAGSETAQLDVGALLYRADGTESWEMLTGSRIRKEPGGRAGSFILYERFVDNLPPGTYRLTAFARSQEVEMFGGAEATLLLPSARSDGLVGPVATLPAERVYRAPLPFRSDRSADDGRTVPPGAGTIPARLTRIPQGARFEATTWLCPADGSPARQTDLVRFVARDGVPLWRLPDSRLDPEGRCARLTDTIATDGMATGRYTYHIGWRHSGAAPGLSADLPFDIVEPAEETAQQTRSQ